jgi:hypothetical protein
MIACGEMEKIGTSGIVYFMTPFLYSPAKAGMFRKVPTKTG